MNHIVHNNIDYVIWKESSEQLELVDTNTGEVSYVSTADASTSQRYTKDLPIEPAAISFPERPKDFVYKLQSQRIEYLRQAQAKKRTDKGPRATVPRAPKVKQPRKTKLSMLVQQQIQQRLASAGVTNPAALDAIKRLTGG
jgi:hypothetical protein